MKRHLYFYACPFEGKNPSAWKRNIQRILSYWPIFNGRKLVTIATGPILAPPEQVKACFLGRDVEFLEVPNDPDKRETNSFLEGLGRFETKAPGEAVFYAHSKGVSYAPGEVLSSIERWCDAMYLLNLGSERFVDWALARHATMGCFRQRLDLAGSTWHYSGTFFWARCADLFARPWRDIHDSKFAVEGYLGRIFKESESFDPCPYTHPAVLYHNAPDWRTVEAWFDAAVRSAS